MHRYREPGQCEAVVMRRGELRLRRGYGFYRDYVKCQCQRGAAENGLCAQHGKMAEWKVERVR